MMRQSLINGYFITEQVFVVCCFWFYLKKHCQVSHTHAKEGPLLPGLSLEARSSPGKVIPHPYPLLLHFLILLLFSPKSKVFVYPLNNLQKEMPRQYHFCKWLCQSQFYQPEVDATFISLGMILGVRDCSWALAARSNAVIFGVFEPVDFAREVGDTDILSHLSTPGDFFPLCFFFFFSLFSPQFVLCCKIYF